VKEQQKKAGDGKGAVMPAVGGEAELVKRCNDAELLTTMAVLVIVIGS
jgi:hypothetical protein